MQEPAQAAAPEFMLWSRAPIGGFDVGSQRGSRAFADLDGDGDLDLDLR